MKLYELFEARKNPEQNPKLSSIEQLKKYDNDPSIYFSMTKLPKLGINPATPWPDTPNGVYAFKVSLIFDRKTDIDMDAAVRRYVIRPFDEYPYIQVLKATSNKILHIDKYSDSDYKRDVNKLISLYPELKDKIAEFQKNPKTHFKNSNDSEHEYEYVDRNNPFIKMFGLVHAISKTPNGWNKKLRELGYDIIEDPGMGYIARFERAQTVFLTPKAYTHLTTINNTASYAVSNKEEQKLSYDKLELMIKHAAREHKQITKFEPQIMQYATTAIEYAKKVLRGRFVRYERKLIREHIVASAVRYFGAMIAPRRWPELEKILYLDPKAYLDYALITQFRKPELEGPLLQYAKKEVDEESFGAHLLVRELMQYSLEVMKGPWPEADRLMQTNYHDYQDYWNKLQALQR